jgi:D-lactate dehydrogenase, membrane binding
VSLQAHQKHARRNDHNWFKKLPPDISAPITHKLYYGHFFCHVFHQDYIVTKSHDTMALEHKMWNLLDARAPGIRRNTMSATSMKPNRP